jgi:hypothetical protein
MRVDLCLKCVVLLWIGIWQIVCRGRVFQYTDTLFFFLFSFFFLAGPAGYALGYGDLLLLFFLAVCVVGGRVEMFAGALDCVWWLQVALTRCAHCRPMGSIVVPP